MANMVGKQFMFMFMTTLVFFLVLSITTTHARHGPSDVSNFAKTQQNTPQYFSNNIPQYEQPNFYQQTEGKDNPFGVGQRSPYTTVQQQYQNSYDPEAVATKEEEENTFSNFDEQQQKETKPTTQKQQYQTYNYAYEPQDNNNDKFSPPPPPKTAANEDNVFKTDQALNDFLNSNQQTYNNKNNAAQNYNSFVQEEDDHEKNKPNSYTDTSQQKYFPGQLHEEEAEIEEDTKSNSKFQQQYQQQYQQMNKNNNNKYSYTTANYKDDLQKFLDSQQQEDLNDKSNVFDTEEALNEYLNANQQKTTVAQTEDDQDLSANLEDTDESNNTPTKGMSYTKHRFNPNTYGNQKTLYGNAFFGANYEQQKDGTFAQVNYVNDP